MSASRLVKTIKNNKFFLAIISLFLIFRLVNLTQLPIFNDEAIYLDWGFREIHSGNLYYSLYDAKTPLLMWIFGIFEGFFSDPLLAGRLVSVLFGGLTLVGIYKLSKKLFLNSQSSIVNSQFPILAALFYTITPIFIFFDRQALMETAIGAIGIWSIYFLIKALDDKSYKNSIFAGAVLGIGYFIKSSSFIFLLTSLLILAFSALKTNRKTLILKKMFFLILLFLTVNFLIFINPLFWQTFSSNSRFVFSLNEILSFPILTWASNLFVNLEICFFFVSPTILLLAVLGIFTSFKVKGEAKTVMLFFIISILLQTFLIKDTSQRYIVSFFPPLAIFASFGLFQMYGRVKNNLVKYILFAIFLGIPLLCSLLLVFNSEEYIKLSSKVSKYSNLEYIAGQTSGYGVKEAVNYIREQSHGEKTMVGIALNTGNPENSIIIYFQKDLNIRVMYLDKRFFSQSFNEIECLSSPEKFFFVSRDDQQADFNKYFYRAANFKNPNADNSVGIYTLKKNCKGKTYLIPLPENSY